ncbi:unnamed protein product [Clavelina lepadiformis]|uniref:ShKT domain-containing protein n=1 Tax=Clavelina lepadiformis TaxID=159417 RepID=A0ABP0EWP4_CLALP
MKFLVIFAFVTLVSCMDRKLTPLKAESCENCKDSHEICGLERVEKMCKDHIFSSIAKAMCRSTCKVCEPCEISPRTCTPETDPCRDTSKHCHFLAPTYCAVGRLSELVRIKCRKSCGECKPTCKPLEIEGRGLTLEPCKPDCKDKYEECPYWKDKYCKGSINSAWTKQNCPYSCGVCKPCDKPSKSSLVPPPLPTTQDKKMMTTTTTTQQSTKSTTTQQSTKATTTQQSTKATTTQQSTKSTTTESTTTMKSKKPKATNTSEVTRDEDECQVECEQGGCFSYGEEKECVCDKNLGQKEKPRCQGMCSVYCPKPAEHDGEWLDDCDGNVICTCNTRGDKATGVLPGALCR